MAIGKAVLKNEVLPLLDNRRRGIPEQWKLEQDDVVVQQALLFDGDVDIEARVVAIQINKRDTIDRCRGTRHVTINVRVLMARVGVVNEWPRHSGSSLRQE